LKAIYPEHAWQDLEFATPSTHVWESVANRKEIIELVGKKLGVETLDDWYKVKRGKVLQSRGSLFISFKSYCFCAATQKHIATHMCCVGGAMISRFYGGYLSKCLRHLYPHHNWVDMNFDVIPDNFWTKQENRRMWMNWAGAQLGVKQMEDWYNVKLQSLKGLGSSLTLAVKTTISILIIWLPKWRLCSTLCMFSETCLRLSEIHSPNMSGCLGSLNVFQTGYLIPEKIDSNS
jgi:hypothetical protein